MIFIIILALSPFFTLFLLFICLNYKASKKPENNPERFLKYGTSGNKNIIVCIGDSITHGRVSFNYVDLLTKRLHGKGFIFVNAGINSELSYNVSQRIKEIVRCKPDYITILIGTNDVNASINEKNCRRVIKKMKLPKKPSKEWYRENLNNICNILKNETCAEIALLSLPPIGEDFNHIGIMQIKEFNTVIREVAERDNIVYLPLFEMMTEYLKKQNNFSEIHYSKWRYILYKGILEFYILGKSLDEISEKNGFYLVTDFLHLNSKGAAMIADLIEGFLIDKGKSVAD